MSQVQTDGYPFVFDVELGFWAEGADTPTIHEIHMDGESRTARFPVDAKPTRVTVDPRTVLLAEWEFSER